MKGQSKFVLAIPLFFGTCVQYMFQNMTLHIAGIEEPCWLVKAGDQVYCGICSRLIRLGRWILYH